MRLDKRIAVTTSDAVSGQGIEVLPRHTWAPNGKECQASDRAVEYHCDLPGHASKPAYSATPRGTATVGMAYRIIRVRDPLPASTLQSHPSQDLETTNEPVP